MCLIAFSLNRHPKYKLILVANRDEFYNRKTAAADYWPNAHYILGGRDLEGVKQDGSFGTWVAISKNGRIAMVTNYRDLKNLKDKAPSRGHLVSDFLKSNQPAYAYLKSIESEKHLYNGFNLIVGTSDELLYLSNYKDGIQELTNGVHGLSNSLLNVLWPKVTQLKKDFGKEISSSDISSKKLLDIMMNESRANDEVLPDTGIGIERERALSSMFIKTNGYGTRCSTAILVSIKNEVTFVERTFNLSDFSYQDRKFEFTIE